MGCALVVITGNKGICGHQMPTPCPSANLFVQGRAKLFHFIAAKSRYDTLQLCPLSILKAVVAFTSKFNFEP
jgi:hypothetical protein